MCVFGDGAGDRGDYENVPKFLMTNFFLHFWKDKPLGVIQKVRSLRREGGPLKSKQKRIGGEGFLACVYVLISLKIQRFSK